MIEKEKPLETEGYLRCLCNDSSMLICRYFLNHDQDGSGESILFSKGREGGHADAVDDPFKKFENLYAGTLCVFVLGGLKRTSSCRSYDR